MLGSLGKYELLGKLGRGGMAEVYLARARGIEGWEKLVALKKIRAHLVEDDGFVRMFLDEARLAARLHHPNVAQVIDIGLEGDSYFFTMEYVRGHDLSRVMKAAHAAGHGLSLGAAIGVVIGVAAGLHHAHELRGDDGEPLGIVHRDVSPSNVLVSDEGAVKVLDFGIAKAATREMSTRTGTLKGKIPYMSPEQTRGDTLDRRSDVFAVGILLYELTTWRRLFKGDNELEVLRRIGDQDAPAPSAMVPDYPPALDAIVARALRRDPAARYQTALELATALEELARDLRLVTTPRVIAEEIRAIAPPDAVTILPPEVHAATTAIAPPTELDPPSLQIRKSARWPIAIGAVAIAAALAGAVWAFDGEPPPAPATPAPAAAVQDEAPPPTPAPAPVAAEPAPAKPAAKATKPAPPKKKPAAPAKKKPAPAKKSDWDTNSLFLPEE